MYRDEFNSKYIYSLCKRLTAQAIAMLCMLCISMPAYAISLNESLSSAYETSPVLKSAIQSLQAVDEDMPTAISGMLPTVSASLDRGKRSSESGATESNGITDSKSIEVNQPIFQGGRTVASIKKAKNTILAERERFKITEQQVLFSVVQAYMNLVRDMEVLELANNNKLVLSHHLEATKSRFELGEVTRTDVSQARASMAKSNSDVISAQNAVESSKATFEKIVGVSPANIKMPKNAITINGEIQELTKIAISNNPFIKTVEYGLNASKNDVSIQKSVLLPKVSVFANKQRESGMLTSAFPVNSDTVGVNLAIPLFQGGSEYSQVRRAKHIAGKNSMDLVAAQNDLREAVITSYNDFKIAQSLIKSNQASVESLEVALDGTNQESMAGLRTTLDVLDAEQALFDARSTLVKSRCDEIVSSYNLLAQLGKLTAKDLGLKVNLYKPEENANKVKYQFVGF